MHLIWSQIVDAVAGEEITSISFTETDTIWNAALSPDETVLATSGPNYMAKVWDVSTGLLLHSFGDDLYASANVAWNSDGSLLATGSVGSGGVRIWDVAGEKTLFTVEMGEDSPHIALNDKLLAVSTVTSLEIWDIVSQELVTYKNHSGLRRSIEWSADNRHLLIANMQILAEGEVCSIEIWDTETIEIVREFKDFPYQITSATWNPDETKILSTDVMGTVRVTDVATGESTIIFQSDQLILSADWSPFGGQVAVGVAIGANAQSARGVVTRDSIPGLAIVVPFASFEQLETLGEACGITSLTRASVAAVVAKDDACGRDFAAVAEAFMNQE
jgi:WD40 repeat protein